jgi:putative hydrolase of the HAD superfamily
MMGVLFIDKDDVKTCLIPFLRSKNITLPDEIIREYYDKASLGMMKSAGFWKLFKLENLDREFLDSRLKYDPEALIMALKHLSGFRFGIISNDISEWSSYLRKKYRINDIVEIAVISGDTGMRKPGEQIFYHFLKLTKAIPENCIFIDDNINNLITARQIGIKSVLLDRDRNFSGNENKADYAIGSWEEMDNILNAVSGQRSV